MEGSVKKCLSEIEDERSKKYLQAVADNIGLLGINHGWDSIKKPFKQNNIKYSMIKQYDIWLNLTGSGKVDIYKYNKDGKTKYAAEFCFRTDIDDYEITSYIFSKMPSKKDIKTVRIMEKIYLDLTFYKQDVVFSCWECGHEVHWLDCKEEGAGLERKYDMWKDNYCGC